MSNINKPKEDDVSFWKSKEVRNFVLAFVVTAVILSSFYYGGFTACELGGGFYYKWACVDLRVVEIPAPQDIRVYNPNVEYDCNSPLFKDNYVLCPIENVTQS
jgi:hypothetical protein